VQATNTRPRFEVVADGQGLCSHVGATLLGELSDRLGLTGELGRRANRGVRAGAYDRGQVLRDLVVMLADGGGCVSDLEQTWPNNSGCSAGWPALAMILRPGNAGSNTTADHVAVLAMALLALPKPARERPILVRADSAGATHAFVDELVARKLWFSIGFDCDQRVQQAILALPEQAWQPAVDADGRSRRGAWVAELATLELAGAGWPEGIQAICRRERPHPGAAHKLGFTDAHGHRFQVYITNQTDPDPAVLEVRHRPHAQVEDRIRGAKASGLRNLPLWGFAANDAWLSLVMIAQTLVCWAQALLLDGDLAVAEPKTLRFRLWHVAGRIVQHARRLIVRLDRAWPWAADLVAAFTRLRPCLPLPGVCNGSRPARPRRCRPMRTTRSRWAGQAGFPDAVMACPMACCHCSRKLG
jgi:hypothetical protein